MQTENTLPTILAISGSLRANSANGAVIVVAEHYVREKARFILYSGLGALPHFDDNQVTPPAVKQLCELIRSADGVLICSPEYAFGVPGSLKNALDWTVKTGEFVHKPTALITAATGGDKAHASLLLTLGALSANIPESSRLLIPFVRSKMNEHGEIVNIEVKTEIGAVMESLLHTLTAADQTPLQA